MPFIFTSVIGDILRATLCPQYTKREDCGKRNVSETLHIITDEHNKRVYINEKWISYFFVRFIYSQEKMISIY